MSRYGTGEHQSKGNPPMTMDQKESDALLKVYQLQILENAYEAVGLLETSFYDEDQDEELDKTLDIKDRLDRLREMLK